jgi:hypothetical protein
MSWLGECCQPKKVVATSATVHDVTSRHREARNRQADQALMKDLRKMDGHLEKYGVHPRCARGMGLFETCLQVSPDSSALLMMSISTPVGHAERRSAEDAAVSQSGLCGCVWCDAAMVLIQVLTRLNERVTALRL